ncbi:MAG: fimbria major subunit [Bacteroides sp.]|nr:fimbria major subunit [Bacteroides sp.]
MKKIYGFAALCAAMTLASCSNNDEPIVPVDGSTTATVAGYLSVNIANTNKDTRAVNHQDYIQGTAGESKATKATFVFFAADGSQISMSADQALTSTTEHTSNIERDYNVMVPVTITETGDHDAAYVQGEIDKIDRVVVILNPTADINAAVSDKSEPQVLAVAADYSTLTSDNGFVMTNSVYMKENGKAYVYGQDVNGKIYSSQLEATQNAVDLYVERVVARVDVKYDPTGFTNTPQSESIYGYDANGNFTETKQTLNIVIKGIEVANIANQSYLVKNLDNSFKTTGRFDAWNDESNFRSHWATAWTLDTDVKAPSRFVEEDNQDKIDYTWFRNQSYNSFDDFSASSTGAKYYINENTNEDYKTALVISAQLCDENGDAVTFYRTVKDGRYYSEEGAYNVLLDMLKREGYYVATEYDAEGKPSKLRNLTEADLEFKSAVQSEVEGAEGYEGYLEFKKDTYADKDIYRTTDGGVNYVAVTNFTENVLHSSNYEVWKWNEGMCYYYVYLTNGEEENIAAEGEEANMVTIDGIVRNHIYDVNIQSIAGLGVPVFDPKDVIIPTTPDKITPNDEWSLACNIHILSWARYTQHANFTNGTDY